MKPESTKPVRKFLKIHQIAINAVSLIEVDLTKEFKQHASQELDRGNTYAEINEKEYKALLLTRDEFHHVNAEKPTPDQAIAFEKLINYDVPPQITRNASEHFDHIYSNDEIKEMASCFASAAAQKISLEEELKSYTGSIKARIIETTATLSRISNDLSRGKETRLVKCLWAMNTPTRGQKTLYRLDTDPKGLVRTVKMLPSDFQMILDDVADLNKKKERTVEEKEVKTLTNAPEDVEIMTDAQVQAEIGGSTH